MSDLVERLRKYGAEEPLADRDLMNEAADEIERLEQLVIELDQRLTEARR